MKRKAFKVIYSSTTSVPNGVINFLNHKAKQVLTVRTGESKGDIPQSNHSISF